MTAIDDMTRANEQHAQSMQLTHPPRDAKPSKHLAIVTCMDTRLDLLPALGLEIGQAHILRNAGGLVTDDMLRSLAISQRALGTTEIAVIHHTRCGMNGFDDEQFRAELASESGTAPGWRVPGFTDAHAQAAESLELVRSCPWLPHRDGVRAFVFDVDKSALTEAD